MERKRIQIIDLDQYEKEILGMVVHAESYATILGEFSGDSFILGDCLRNLVRRKVLHLLEWNEKGQVWERRMIYDADKLSEYRYQLSSLGLNMLEHKNE
ncbi:MAG: hypothetical protein GC180_03135 [Bacteroidetes bacterium]|nr:hypothetical protein [Bacteroidota bacterium]